jgi:hypothetical protein
MGSWIGPQTQGIAKHPVRNSAPGDNVYATVCAPAGAA